jgi:hypothetical protein
VDLALEARHLWQFNYNFRRSRHVRFPFPIYPLVAPEVLVETFEEGEGISNYVADKGRSAFKSRRAHTLFPASWHGSAVSWHENLRPCGKSGQLCFQVRHAHALFFCRLFPLGRAGGSATALPHQDCSVFRSMRMWMPCLSACMHRDICRAVS